MIAAGIRTRAQGIQIFRLRYQGASVAGLKKVYPMVYSISGESERFGYT